MSNESTAVLVLIFMTCTALSIFYWEVVYFVLVRGIKFKLFSLRDEARRLSAENGEGTTFHHQEMEKFACKTITIAPEISLLSFILFFFRKDIPEPDKRFENEAPKEYIAIRNRIAKLSIIIMMLNSPGLMMFTSCVVPVLWALGKISSVVLYRKAADFVENIESRDCGDTIPVAC